MTKYTLELSKKDHTDKEWALIIRNFYYLKYTKKSSDWIKENNITTTNNIPEGKIIYSAPSEETLIMFKLKWL